MFTNGLGDLGSISRLSHTKDSKKWYLMPPCLTLSIIRYGSRVKWRNPGKGVAPFPTLWCSSYWKGSLRVTLDKVCQLYFIYIYVYIYIYIYMRLGLLKSFVYPKLTCYSTYSSLSSKQMIFCFSSNLLKKSLRISSHLLVRS